MSPVPPDTLDLLLRHAGGDATADQVAELERRLREDPVALRQLTDLSLEAMAIAELAEPGFRAGLPGHPLVMGRMPLPWLAPLAAAAALLVAFAGAGLLIGRDPHILRVAALEGAVRWTGQAGRITELTMGAPGLSGGTVETLADDALVTLVFRDGSTLVLNGRTAATISDEGQKRVRLHGGSLSVEVAKQPAGKPFVVSTPTARAEVLGTKFALESVPAATLLSVDSGLVRLTRLVDGSVAEVPADHEARATIDQDETLAAVRRPVPPLSWRSDLSTPECVFGGDWHPPGAEHPARVMAETKLVESAGRPPRLLGTVVLQVADPVVRGVRLAEETVVRVKGRLRHPARVVVMLSNASASGGFAGNYFFSTAPTLSEGQWELRIPVAEFVPPPGLRAALPVVGTQARKVHIYTHHAKAGLLVEEIEIAPSVP